MKWKQFFPAVKQQVENVETTNDYTSPCTSSVYLYSAHPAALFTTIDPLQLRAMLEVTFTRGPKVKLAKVFFFFFYDAISRRLFRCENAMNFGYRVISFVYLFI